MAKVHSQARAFLAAPLRGWMRVGMPDAHYARYHFRLLLRLVAARTLLHGGALASSLGAGRGIRSRGRTRLPQLRARQ
eukprot:4190650-Alexandrium_andersonii.AAC.1